MTTTKEQINDCILDFCLKERLNIEFERTKNKNLSKAFRGVGDFGEELTTYLFPNSFGSASKGGCAFDNIEIDFETHKPIAAREVKTCCQIQPKSCTSCSNKTPYFQNSCMFCGSSSFKEIKDTRFGIDSEAHFKYETLLKEYVLIVVDYSNLSQDISIKIYKIPSSNIYFTNYLKNQRDNSKSSNCNLLPYSYDFYASGPILMLDYDINMANEVKENFYNLENMEPIGFDISKIKKQERVTYGLKEEVSVVPYAEIQDKLVLRKKNLNKPRGETNRL
jgi:hypothetical protein